MISFVVRGTPRSHQAKKSKKHWMQQVRESAPASAELLDGALRLRIDFFFEGVTDLDSDNIIKPIQDALEEIIYMDDSSIVDVCSRKINRSAMPRLVDAPAPLLRTLAEDFDGDFVLIRVSNAFDQVTFR